MQLVYKYRIQNRQDILDLCFVSKNLYNQSLYKILQNLKINNKFLFYNDLNNLMKSELNLEGNINYRLLKIQVSQQILKTLDKDIKSYIKSIKDWSKNHSKYRGQPKLPKFKRGYNQLIYTNQACTIKNNEINLSKKLKITIPQWKDEFTKFNQIRILPKKNFIEIEIVYQKEQENYNLNYDTFASIDLGINNLVTLIQSNQNSLIISGKQLKSINQFYNKQKSKFYCIKDKMNLKYTNKLERIDQKRNDRIQDILHKVSKFIVQKLIKNKIGNLVVGYNKSWKNSIKLGHKINQTFVSIPYLKLLNFLKYKCELCGIKFQITEESYTSKIDSLALEELNKQEIYLGKRIKRGLFQSSIGKLINADVNGALNILRKVTNDSLTKVIIDSGFLFNPLKIRNIYCLNSL